MTGEQEPNLIPAVISSNSSQGLEKTPEIARDWKRLHQRHVARLQSGSGVIFGRLGIDQIVIHSGLSRQKYSLDDQYWPVAATPSFVHWTPYLETPALLVLRPETRPELICERHSSYWEGPGPASDEWDRESFDVRVVDDLSRTRVGGKCAFIGDDLKLAHELGIPPEQCNRQDLLNLLAGFRTLKSDYEVASMRKANETALAGHNKLSAMFQAGVCSELDLHLAYLSETSQTDFTVPYGNIVALGEHCGILHHVHYDRTPRKGDLSLLVDAGATCHGYASDITRTYARGSGAAALAFKGLIDGVDSIQRRLVSMVKVGLPYEDLHNQSHVMLAELLKSSGLVNLGVEEMVARGVTRAFFPHGLGHSLGIQVHDVGMRLVKPAPENPYLRNTSTITAGQVVTIEPGLYFIPTLMDELRQGKYAGAIDQALLSRLQVFGGIRIEDNILATSSGPVNLTRG